MNGIRASQVSFELFAREFLIEAGYEVVADPDRGADDGRDLIVVERRMWPGG
jgi:HJR/Mrr/RecB family endonuclease